MKCEWNKVTLGDIATVKGGRRLPKGVNLMAKPNAHPYIRVRDLGNKKIIELDSSFEYVDEETQKSISRYIVSKGDIVISIVGTVGLIGIIGESLNNANLTENCVKLTNLKNIDKNFLYYYLISSQGKNEINRGTVGAVQAKLPIKNIQAMQLRLPPMSVQIKIASILAALDDKIELNNKINENLEQQAQAIFKSWFVDFEPWSGICPEDWKQGTFSDIISSTLGGNWGKETPIGNYTEKVYCIRGSDIPDVNSGNKGIMPERYILPKYYDNNKLKANDIVVEISGGSPSQSTGRVAIISDALLGRYDKGMICTNFCRVIKPVEGYSSFIYYYWQYLYNLNVFFSYENGTTGIKNLDIAGFLENETIIIPNIESVQKFDSFCKSIFKHIFSNGLENEKLCFTRDTLLPKLMSGELDVSSI